MGERAVFVDVARHNEVFVQKSVGEVLLAM